MGADIESQAKNAEERPKPTLTQHQFLSWKRQKDAAASARKAEVSRKRAEDIAAGTVQMNGRELFLHEPWVFDNSRY
ncbi:zinc finger CCCH domain-containing protein 15 homolog [Abrus precatorius]|uniref:Zinc finger CCCH domain-containing protein 15 homolog n=1 Tax=Abrus precatorius TaxID=3816 RepID=A0A8B8JP99_ABRPR|nr:zinc finger CCCH domain-containing protein 15 homolog [Abrus precatorius]